MGILMKRGLTQRLYIVSAVLSLALVGTGIATWTKLTNVSTLALNASAVRSKQLERIASTELCVSQVLSTLRHAMLVNDPKEVDAAAQHVIASRQQITKNDNEFMDALPTEQAKDDFKNIWLKMQADTWPVADQNIKLVREGNNEAAFQMLMKTTVPTFAHMQKWLSEARAAQNKQLQDEVSDVSKAALETRVLLMALSGCIAVGLAEIGRAHV